MKGGGERLIHGISRVWLETQLRLARARMGRNRIVAGLNLAVDLMNLDLHLPEEQHQVLLELFEEIGPEDFKGPDPPNHIAMEPRAKGLRMLQFAWRSKCFEDRFMYLKFCLADGERIVILRLHEHFDPNRFERMAKRRKS